jgi:hypothetical protein
LKEQDRVILFTQLPAAKNIRISLAQLFNS